MALLLMLALPSDGVLERPEKSREKPLGMVWLVNRDMVGRLGIKLASKG